MIRTRPAAPARDPAAASAGPLLERYGRLLDEEYAALLAADEAGMARLLAEKTTLIEPLAAVARPADEAGRTALAALVRKQRRNGRMIAERLNAVQRQLEFFTAGAPAAPPGGATPSLYGRGGVEYARPPARLSTRI